MRPNSGFISVTGGHPLLGLNSEIDSFQLPAEFSPRLENVIVRQGEVFRRSGYHPLVNNPGFVGIVLKVVDFTLLDGTRILVAVTTLRLYRFDEGTDKWQDVTARTEQFDVVDVNQSQKEFRIGGDQTNKFDGVEHVLVENSTENDGEYGVSSVSYDSGDDETVIEVFENIPDRTVDGTISGLYETSTLIGDFVDHAIGTDDNGHWLFITNGRDMIRVWDGTDNFEIFDPEFENLQTAQTIRVFFGHLVLGGIRVGGTDHEKTISWSDTGKFTKFEDGNAGHNLMSDLIGRISRLEVLGDRMMIYSDDSIGMMTFTGAVAIFNFESVVQGTRLVSPKGVINLGPVHLFASEDNIFLFEGTRSLMSIGDRIRRSYRRDLNTEFGSRLHGFNDSSRGVAFLSVPSDSDSAVVYTFEYDLFDIQNFTWSREQYADLPISFSFFHRRGKPTWVDPPDVSWEDWLGIWVDESEKIDFPVRVMSSLDQVFVMDEISGKDITDLQNESAVEGQWESPDLTIPELETSGMIRWGSIELSIGGKNVKIEVSTDGGISFKKVAEFTTNHALPRMRRVKINKIGRSIRVRVRSSSMFRIVWYRVWGKLSGIR